LPSAQIDTIVAEHLVDLDHAPASSTDRAPSAFFMNPVPLMELVELIRASRRRRDLGNRQSLVSELHKTIASPRIFRLHRQPRPYADDQ
jgi:hypothetical protein